MVDDAKHGAQLTSRRLRGLFRGAFWKGCGAEQETARLRLACYLHNKAGAFWWAACVRFLASTEVKKDTDMTCTFTYSFSSNTPPQCVGPPRPVTSPSSFFPPPPLRSSRGSDATPLCSPSAACHWDLWPGKRLRAQFPTGRLKSHQGIRGGPSKGHRPHELGAGLQVGIRGKPRGVLVEVAVPALNSLLTIAAHAAVARSRQRDA